MAYNEAAVKLTGLLNYAVRILNDECPPDRAAYRCMMGEAEDEYCCKECWCKYLQSYVNTPLKSHNRDYTVNIIQ